MKKESLRDNITDLEILLTNIGETTTKELAKKYNPKGLDQNRNITNKGIKLFNKKRAIINRS